ncbi:MAG: hypothetical protein LIO65_05335 [Odoribacter sp.]|nr:hypothetical protein [Odoribacter sp.]
MYYKGDYQLYVDETEFYIDEKGTRTLFSVLIPLIPGLDELNIDLGTMTLDIGEYIKNTQYTSSLKLGLYLSTEN